LFSFLRVFDEKQISAGTNKLTYLLIGSTENAFTAVLMQKWSKTWKTRPYRSKTRSLNNLCEISRYLVRSVVVDCSRLFAVAAANDLE